MQAKVQYHLVFNSYLFLFLAQYRLAHTVKSPLTATPPQLPLFCVDSPYIHLFNPLSPNSDQDQYSPNNTHTLSTDKL